jgi:hypothetical protein
MSVKRIIREVIATAAKAEGMIILVSFLFFSDFL